MQIHMQKEAYDSCAHSGGQVSQAWSPQLSSAVQSIAYLVGGAARWNGVLFQPRRILQYCISDKA